MILWQWINGLISVIFDAQGPYLRIFGFLKKTWGKTNSWALGRLFSLSLKEDGRCGTWSKRAFLVVVKPAHLPLG